MPRHRRILIGLLVAIILLGHAACMLLMRECWPFSWYPVYSSIAQSDLVVFRLVAIARDTAGAEFESVVTSQKYVPGYTETFMRNNLRRKFGWGTEPELRQVADVVRDYVRQYEDRRKSGQHDGPPLARVELRRLTFDSESPDTDVPIKSEPLVSVDSNGKSTMLIAAAPKPIKPKRDWGRAIGLLGLAVVFGIIFLALRPGRYSEFLFAPRDARWLGWNRLIFFTLMVWFYFGSDLASVAHRSADSYLPTGLFDYLKIPPPRPDAMHGMQIAWMISLALAAAGLFTRFSTAAALALGAYLLGMQHQWGKQGHGDAMLVLVMLVFACARAGDDISLDSLVRKRIGRAPRPAQSGEYTWPIKLTWLIMAVAIGASGVAKLRVSGWDWALSDNLSNVIRQHFVGSLSTPFVPRSVGLWLAGHGWLTKSGALISLLVEVFFPLALLGKWLRRLIVPAMILLQVNIAVLMGVVFTQFILVYAMWVNWPWLGGDIRRRFARSGASSPPVPVESAATQTP